MAPEPALPLGRERWSRAFFTPSLSSTEARAREYLLPRSSFRGVVLVLRSPAPNLPERVIFPDIARLFFSPLCFVEMFTM